MPDKVLVDNETGEVFEAPKFRNAWSNPFGVIKQDLSRETEEVFEEVAPFALDPETGKMLNPTSQPMLISKGFVNVQEQIQSYKDEVDIYTILNKMAAGDMSAFVTGAQYGDISELPKDLNSYSQYVRQHLKALDELNPELAKMVVDPNVSAEDIESKATAIYNERLEQFNNNNVTENNGKESK